MDGGVIVQCVLDLASHSKLLVVLGDFKSVAIGIKSKQIPGTIMGPLFGVLQNLAPNLRDTPLIFPDVVALDSKVWRWLVIPAIVSVQFIVGPQMQLIWPELHPRNMRA